MSKEPIYIQAKAEAGGQAESVYCWRCFCQFAVGDCLRDEYGEYECRDCTQAMAAARMVILEEGQRAESMALGIFIVGLAGALAWAVLIWCVFDGGSWINRLLASWRR